MLTRRRARHCFLVLVALIGLYGTPAAAQYLFTPVALSGDTFDPFGFGPPVLNDLGQVAFTAMTVPDPDFNTTQGIFRFDGASLTPIALEGDQFSRFGDVSINNLGQVGFEGSFEQVTGEGIFRGDGGPVVTIAGTRQAGDFDFVNAGPQINAVGSVAFIGETETDFTGGVFVGDGGAVTALYDTNDPFDGFSGNPALNAAGQAAFLASLNTGGNGLFLGSGGAFVTVADVTGPIAFFFSDPSLNERGDVAFTAGTNENPDDNTGATGTGVFLFRDGSLTPVLQGGFDQFFGLGDPSLNEAGEVAFVADLGFDEASNLIQVLLTGPDFTNDRVIGTGEALLGRTVAGLNFSREGLNDAGQLAFTAFFDDGSSGVFLATPGISVAAPEPSSLVLLGVGMGVAGLVRRRRTR